MDVSVSPDWRSDLPEPQKNSDDFAEYYDLVLPDPREELEYWSPLVSKTGATLEMGCGSGRLTHGLANHGSIVGVDRSSKMLEKAAEAATVERPVQLLAGDLRAIPAPDGQFETVLCPGAVFSHLISLADQLVAARELSRVTAPGGLVVVDMPFHQIHELTVAPQGKPKKVLSKKVGDVRVDVWAESSVDGVFNFVDLRETVRIRRPSGVTTHDLQLRTKAVTATEATLIFAAAGLDVVKIDGGYDRRPFGASANRLIVHLRKR